MLPFDALVVGLHLRWRGVWQRPNHLLMRFAAHVPVFVVEEPVAGERDWNEFETVDGITVLRPHRLHVTDTIDRATCEAVRERLSGSRPLIWLYSAQMLALADAFPAASLVYDKMDDLTRFKGADSRIALREPELVRRAATVFAGGRSLFETVREQRPSARCYPSGVDVPHFARARSIAEHPALAGLARPRAGYIGVIDERIDLDLIARLAKARRDLTLVMVGPIAKIDPATLPVAPNIAYLGPKTYGELPSLLAGFDAAIMPFALNEATAAISPTKTLEYLAAGKGVASTAVCDVVTDYAGIVEFGDTPEEFSRAVERAMLRRDDASERNVAAKLEAGSWDAIASAMWRDVLDSIAVARGSKS